MILKRIFCLLSLLVPGMLAIAQETRVPLLNNPILNSFDSKMEEAELKKSGTNFPLIDYFRNSGKTNSMQWMPNGCEILNHYLVLNALDSNNLVYPAGVAADEITSEPIQILGQPTTVFLSFTVNSGETFQLGDTLFVYGKDLYGEWKKLWQSPNVFMQNREVVIDLPMEQFSSNLFAIRFAAYTLNLTPANTSIFKISKLVTAAKWPIPYYDYLRIRHLPDSVPSWNYFSGPDVKVFNGGDFSYAYGNVAKLDINQSNGGIYEDTSNAYGGADTLYTHPIDVISNPDSDSIFYSFSIKSGATNLAADSLIVEFKNNLGNWVRVLSLAGTANNTGYSVYSFNINLGRNRHSAFQSRFIFKSTFSSGNSAHWLLSGFRLVKRISLPFFDDFSNSRISVNPDRWLDNQVYVNNDFPVLHPSINVATFDGLDANGNAYSKFAFKGICDKLTSKSMNLKGLTVADSVILSFYYEYEPQGTTDQVYPDDSLIVELRNSAIEKDSFAVVKMISAHDSLLNHFTYYHYVITDPKFFHEDFQFRIKNRGSLTGNLSQWHIDYIRFNKGRKINDAIKDLALTNTPAVVLGPYTNMPWYQYQANMGKYTHGEDSLRLVNHDNQPYAVDYFRSVIKPEGDTLDKYNNILPSIQAQSDSTVSIKKNFNFATAVSADSLVFHTRYRIKISGNQNDNVTGNDTISIPTIFSNYYAYDDGSAEGGYGVKNKLNVGVSLKYRLELPDSVVGVYIFFNQSEKDVSTQRFNLKIWQRISPLFEPATTDVVLYNQEVPKPYYSGKINGFTSYRFPQPIAVSDSFYIGWDQTSSYVLNVGLDKNYRYGVNPNMAYKMDGRWYPAEIPGALMIRPIMKNFLGTASALPAAEPLTNETYTLYPNPTEGTLFISLPNAESYRIRLVDMTGKEISSLSCIEGKIILPEISAGFYMVIFENSISNQTFVKKIILRR